MSKLASTIDWRAGDTWQIDATVTKSDGTSWTDIVAATWKLDSLDLDTNYITKTLGSGIINPSAGRLLIEVLAAATAAIAEGNYTHSLQIEDSGGLKSTQFYGPVKVRQAPA